MLFVAEVQSRPAFMALENEWNCLAESSRNAVNDRHEFVRLFMDSFFPNWKGIRILLARDEKGTLRAILPLRQYVNSYYGIPTRRLDSAINHYFTRFDLIAEDPELAARIFLAYLSSQRDWDLMELKYCPKRAQAWWMYHTAMDENFSVSSDETMQSPYITLPSRFDILAGRLKSKFRSNLRRRRIKLAEKGKIEFEKFTEGPDLYKKLEIGFAVEESGWKGTDGTAIARDPAARKFYSQLAMEASRRGYLSLYFLKLNGWPIAFQFGLHYNRRYLFLKPGYDESYSAYSPGHLLVEEVLKDCIAQGCEEFDFMAECMPWKADWTQEFRPHSNLFLFNTTVIGQVLAGLKLKGIPWIKRMLGRHSASPDPTLTPKPV